MANRIETRKLDNLGRFVVPSSFVKALQLNESQKMEMTIEYGYICIKKFESNNVKNRAYVGIVRIMDPNHRFTIPAEFLNVLGISTNQNVSLILVGNIIKLFLP